MKHCLFILLIILFFGCKPKAKKEFRKLVFNTQGTSLNLIINYIEPSALKVSIDSLLTTIDLELSTYVDSSAISRFNKNQIEYISSKDHPKLANMLRASANVSMLTNGCFDPFLKNLMDYYKFDKFNHPERIDSLVIDSIQKIDRTLRFVDANGIKKYSKTNPNTQLDFNAIAQGYSVDLIGELLDDLEVSNYLIELGGEIKSKGMNHKALDWKVGIDLPVPSGTTNSRELHSTVQLTNRALATSGNYRKYYVLDGIKYAHTINPFTGFPAKNSLLSATVITDECALADALATSFMVMGLDSAVSFIDKHPEIDLQAIFVYSKNDSILTYFTDDIANKMELIYK
jgi:thiamine biosynthesis lipoprotein